MPADTDEIVVGGSGTVYVAPVATTAPVDSDSALAGGFVDLGYVTEDGITFTDTKDVSDLNAWQSFYPVRRIITSRASSVSFALEQWNEVTTVFAFGGGTITNLGGGEYKYTPPDADDLDERALVVDWVDGTKNYRLYMPRGIVMEAVETNVTRTDRAVLPITFGAISDGATAPYLLFTDDPAFA